MHTDNPPTHPLQRLGQSDLRVSAIGLGVMQFAGDNGVFRFVFKRLAQEQMNAIVQAALDHGVNWFDTAEMYGRGASERGLARGLRAAGRQPGEVIVGTKWLPILRRAGNIRRTIDKRLRALEGYPIDLYMIHQPWSLSSPEAEMQAMADLVEAGKIRTVGVSNFGPDRLRRAYAALEQRGIPLAVNQVQYSLLHRDIERNGILAACRELGVTVVAWGPLASGLLTGRYHRDPAQLRRAPVGRRQRLALQIRRSHSLINTLQALAENHDVTPAQVALNWLIHAQGHGVVAIPGASSPRQAAENADAANFTLSESEMDQLNRVSASVR
jgi:aryl-alcohol dehydrogenase-like predicted oxidoreductase